MKIQCIAIDDEPLALKKLAGYIQKIPFLELKVECRSASEAMDYMHINPVQLIFTDINMPDINGMEFVRSLTNKPFIVFTTAYSEYALEGFQVEAVDYLLKPVIFASFLKAATKVKNLIDLTAKNYREKIQAPTEHLFVKSEYRQVRIEIEEIKFIESQHEYIKIHLINGNSVITKMSLKSMEELLPSDKFLKVHRSFIVNLAKITLVERNRIIFDEKVYIPVSTQFKENLQSYLDGKSR